MLSILGDAVLSYVEKALVDAAPEIEQVVLEQLGQLGNRISDYLSAKVHQAAAVVEAVPVSE